MLVKLVNGQKVELTKPSSMVTSIRLGLGWSISDHSASHFDLDALALLVDETGNIRSKEHVVFYNQLTAFDGVVVLSNDNQNGAGTGDDEQLFIQLSYVPASIHKIVVAIVIHEADERGQTFGEVNDAFVRIVSDETKEEIACYELEKDFSNETAVVIGEVCRTEDGWTFKTSGKGIDGGINSVCQAYGMMKWPDSFFEKKKALTKTSPLYAEKPLF
ncbi:MULTISPECIES: TerD family protein [Bacillaceae]|uniref:TerD family protein n=1 Tax=Bacillaceae TaxID=186817 RepID=UPI00039ABE9D|nr:MULTISPECIES: TerD family protein [Bacillaceae]